MRFSEIVCWNLHFSAAFYEIRVLSQPFLWNSRPFDEIRVCSRILCQNLHFLATFWRNSCFLGILCRNSRFSRIFDEICVFIVVFWRNSHFCNVYSHISRLFRDTLTEYVFFRDHLLEFMLFFPHSFWTKFVRFPRFLLKICIFSGIFRRNSCFIQILIEIRTFTIFFFFYEICLLTAGLWEISRFMQSLGVIRFFSEASWQNACFFAKHVFTRICVEF